MNNNNNSSKNGTYYWALVCGVLSIAVIVLGVLLGIYCRRDEFSDISSPLIFPNSYSSTPHGCENYRGCFFPDSLSNPVNLNTNKRFEEEDEDKIWCELSWRDCNTFQKCDKGKCVN